MTIKTMFIAATAIFSLHVSATEAPEQKFDQERYNVIKNAVDTNTGWFKPEFQKQADDISIVEAHIKDIEARINQKQSITSRIIRTLSSLFRGSFITAGLGMVATLGAAMQSYNLLQIPDIKFSKEYDQVITSYSYPEYLKLLYTNLLPSRLGITPFSISDIEADRMGMTERFIEALSPLQKSTVELGLAAPLVGFGMMASYSISKYLWNKAKSYQKEIDDLTAELELDEHLLNLLKIYGAKTLIL